MKKIMIAIAICMALTLCACNNTTKPTEKETTSGEATAAVVASDTNTNDEITTVPDRSDATESDDSTPSTTKPDESTTQPEKTDNPAESTKPAETTSQKTQPSGHQHSYSAAVTQPTCTAQGYTTYSCSCGHSYRANETVALGHQAGDWVTTVAAKVGTAGQRERRCTRCGTVMQTEVIPALRDPNSVTPEESARIIREVSAYAESYRAKGFTFEWNESMEFSWEVGWYGTPRIKYEGVDGVISRLKNHVDKIYKASTDPSLGMTTNTMTYKVVKTMADGDVAFAVIYGG